MVGQIFAPFQRYGLSQFMRDAQAIQCDGIQRNLIGSLGHLTGGRCCKAVGRIAVVGPADLHLAAGQLIVFSKAQYDTFTQLLYIRMGSQFLCLFWGNVLKAGLCVIAGLAEGHFHQILIHALGQSKQCSEHKCSHQDSQNCHQIAALIFAEGALIQHPDGIKFSFLVLLGHSAHHLYCATMRPSSMRITRSAICAISGL